MCKVFTQGHWLFKNYIEGGAAGSTVSGSGAAGGAVSSSCLSSSCQAAHASAVDWAPRPGAAGLKAAHEPGLTTHSLLLIFISSSLFITTLYYTFPLSWLKPFSLLLTANTFPTACLTALTLTRTHVSSSSYDTCSFTTCLTLLTPSLTTATLYSRWWWCSSRRAWLATSPSTSSLTCPCSSRWCIYV